jgi:hypothetical protein
MSWLRRKVVAVRPGTCRCACPRRRRRRARIRRHFRLAALVSCQCTDDMHPKCPLRPFRCNHRMCKTCRGKLELPGSPRGPPGQLWSRSLLLLPDPSWIVTVVCCCKECNAHRLQACLYAWTRQCRVMAVANKHARSYYIIQILDSKRCPPVVSLSVFLSGCAHSLDRSSKAMSCPSCSTSSSRVSSATAPAVVTCMPGEHGAAHGGVSSLCG